jgi:hypothetical protein
MSAWKWLAALVLVLAALVLALAVVGRGVLGSHEGPGTVTSARIPSDLVRARAAAQRRAAQGQGVSQPKQVLFGDLHVHTTASFDAFLLSLPLLQGEGAHPQADACDFARYCSALDFWSINDHSEGLTPVQWRDTVRSIRECNAVAGDPQDPDVVAYLGWEWTQVGITPQEHYGHKNVVLLHTEGDRIPARPISSGGLTSRAAGIVPGPLVRGWIAATRGGRYHDLARFLQERSAYQPCPEGISSPDLPPDCLEIAPEPADLFRKLDEWGTEALVIPHGTTWGFYTPPGSSWDKQLGPQHDPARQRLIEVYSGHGNSEEYRDWRAVELGPDGSATCPEPRPDYLPTCWRAGEIVAERCRAAGLEPDECERRAAEARRYAAQAGAAAHLTVPGVEATDWLDAGQCRDCFLPSFNYRPGSSVQYILALGRFADSSRPERFRFGFLASSDNHTARPGTGYKELNRREMTEAAGPVSPDDGGALLRRVEEEPEPRARQIDLDSVLGMGFQALEFERQASFFLTGGLVAVHSEGRSREAIWDALQRREVYGTSGPRILLWFDLVDGESRLPMGSGVARRAPPHFEARAVGSFEQAPGCPDYATQSLTPERLHHLCRDECYNPTDRRRPITRIEVVRIRPQSRPGEPVAGLIEDPWRVFPCPGDPAGCRVAFDDPDFPDSGRDALYYVRAIEAPSPAVNAANLRCDRDEEGNCIAVHPCFGDWRTDYEDDCLAPAEERAWSSPIFVDWES